jgi:hypothetical protein
MTPGLWRRSVSTPRPGRGSARMQFRA